ncbi:TIGR02099 family protein [Vibrio sinensis]|uniref:TIGR02099 family protein n=1 Tax=Vibrio sinensis TaxID=2302434 RepID=A0A3A6QPU4_9VIBR|nr:YhdP family protein [Vibrio sinensis]RJX70695.1 TIGR02099 family protein [Vibrio sinensis]
MNSTVNRLVKFFLWLTLTVIVILAITVTVLRATLPRLDQFQTEITQWVAKSTGIEFEIGQISGFWRNTHPSIQLLDVQAKTPQDSDIHFSTQKVEVEFDLFQSLIQLQPVITDLNIHDLKLDLRAIDWAAIESTPSESSHAGEQKQLVQQLDQLLLRQLDEFSLLDSDIRFIALDGVERQLDIQKLRWKNQGNRHKAEGNVSFAGTSLSSLGVVADFVDHGSLTDVSGEFYLSAENIRVTPWLTSYLQAETGIEHGQISLNSWVTLEHSKPINAYVKLEPSELIWQDAHQHSLMLESGVFDLEPTEKGWQINGRSLKLRTDSDEWPELDISLDWQPKLWRLNVSQLELETIVPLLKLSPQSSSLSSTLENLKMGGLVEDIRVSMGDSFDSLRYSASLTNGRVNQWDLLPEVHKLSASVAGDLNQAKAKVTLIDDQLPYGDVFQAPLNIRQSEVDIVWQNNGEQGFSLWSDKVTAATPDLQVLGAFRLDFPKDKSPFLSFYAEADLYNAGETWRYLPTLALGLDLTDYLSTAIQGGKVNTAKLLWYGELGNFPYKNNDGMFQAWVGLKDAKFSFDTAWPPITDLQLDLLFQNDAMYLDSSHATLKGMQAQRITGRIPELAENGHLEIEAKVSGQGNAVRDYMMASPLVDSVGAALTTVQVAGKVTSSFQLDIPFSDYDTRAWGYADLNNSLVTIDTPPMTLESVSGRIKFDNDVVSAAGLAAQLLEQSVSVDFNGENAGQGYAVNIDVVGDWDLKPLEPYVGKKWLNPLKGHAPWRTDVDIQLNDVGFTYQIDSSADLTMVSSQYPYPLNKQLKEAGKARLQASGNQQTISARLQLPNLKYQAEINIASKTPVISATNLVLGKGSYKISPVVGHYAQIRSDKLNLDDWFELLFKTEPAEKGTIYASNMPTIPMPQRVDLDVKELTVASVDWNDVVFDAKRKNLGWYMTLDSQEAKGEASYIEPYDLTVALDRLHVYVPALDKVTSDSSKTLFKADDQSLPLISNLDRSIHEYVPNLTLTIDDFWIQGYKVGETHLDLQRKGNTLEWKKLSVKSGSSHVDMNGSWTLDEKSSHTKLNITLQGDDNSEVMERFGISSGIQKASFDITSALEWDGAPWSMKVDSLHGDVDSKFGKGVISDVSGAARLLGLFSLDSIIRKMQLDFSDVFDKGMAFNSIEGTGEIKNGIFLTNDITMDAVAGEMTIKGLVNLNSRLIDAEVNFVPDITSGIPVLTAFAVTPQTALYVLAITTVIAPVVEVFTQVTYEVKGPIDAPVVKELSRSKGEFKLPKKLRELAK